MTLFTQRMKDITKEEWNELNALNGAIQDSPFTVTPEKMELFSELFVRTLEGKGDQKINNTNTNPENNNLMPDIYSHIQRDKEILDDASISPQMRRHTAEELTALEEYQKRHPDDSHDPTALELYCDSHPDALECRIYEE